MSQCQGHAKQQEMDERIPPEWYRKQIAVEGYDEQNCKNEIIGNREYIQVLEDRTNRYEQEIASLREQLENCQILTVRIENERNAIALALETENQVATRYAQQMAYWIEKCDVVRKERDAALKTDQEPVAWCVAYDDPRMGRIHSDPSTCEPAVDAHVLNCEGRISKVPLYLHPARTLSDEEIEVIWFSINPKTDRFMEVVELFARAVLKEASK